MTLNKTIKDQCERNREFDANRTVDNKGKIHHKTYASIRITDLDQLTQQTAEAVLSAVRELVEGERLTTDPRSKEVNAHIATWEQGYNHALDDLLTQLTNKDV